MIVINTGLEEMHTFDGYFTSYLFPGYLLLYYINAGISEHPLNPTGEMKYIDKCYVLCKNVQYLKYNFDVLVDTLCLLPSFYFGGVDLLSSTGGVCEYEVKAEKVLLLLPDDYSMSKTEFRPVDASNPRFSQNMKTSEVIRFLCTQLDFEEY